MIFNLNSDDMNYISSALLSYRESFKDKPDKLSRSHYDYLTVLIEKIESQEIKQVSDKKT